MLPPSALSVVIVLVFQAVLAGWVAADATGREAPARGHWVLATLVLGPLAAAFYLAERPLNAGERRTGGTRWVTLSRFALLSTVLTLLLVAESGISAALEAGTLASGILYTTGYAAGVAIASKLWLVWLALAPTALCAGLFFRQPDVVEVGPSGPLTAKA